jgi:tRNA-2-methylthio-N6-dimethylallyladenosine synthase
MNKADSERIGVYLEQVGCVRASSIEDADLIVLNSCVVRESAQRRVVGKLSSLKALKRAHPAVILALTGCLVDSHIDDIKLSFPHVDIFFPPQDFASFRRGLEERGASLEGGDEDLLFPRHPAVSTFVPIIKGCDNFCSYCIVPYRRGREKSRPVEEIVCEVEELVRRGAKEVVLLGQNVDSYGHDLPSKPDLSDLLSELNGVRGLLRIRFLTSHPKDMSQKLIASVSRLDKVCEDISLAVQSGDDDILKAMRRGYSGEQFCELVERIRSTIPNVGLSTDAIVGFPGESEEQFERTVSLVSNLKFDTVHVAAYSPRPGTIAARKFRDDVPLLEKKRRWKKIEEMQKVIASEINNRLLDKTVEILVEGKEKGKWKGRTRTGKWCFFESDGDHTGQLVNVRIEKTSPWSLQGEAIL